MSQFLTHGASELKLELWYSVFFLVVKENETCSAALQRNSPLAQCVGVNLYYFSVFGARSSCCWDGRRLCPRLLAEQAQALGLPLDGHLVFAYTEC